MMIYVNGDDGYLWITCDDCHESLHCLDAGDLWIEIVHVVDQHRCVERVTE